MSISQRFIRPLFCVMLSCVAVAPAYSRTWKTTPSEVARDYVTIVDSRSKGELVMIMWLAAPMIAPGSSGAQIVAATLDRYVVILVGHGQTNQSTGAMSFEDVSTLEARDGAEKPLALMARDALPPVTAGILVSVETVFRQSLGIMGKGMKVFVFDTGTVHSCEKGGLSVPFMGETYTWETPIPGCPEH